MRRIEGHTVHPPHLVVPGFEWEYLARWQRLGVSLLFAWWRHVAVVIGGAAWLSRRAARAEFEFGIQLVTLAPLWRRAVATGVDAVLLFTALLWFERFCFANGGGRGWGAPLLDELALANELFNVEQALCNAVMTMSGAPLQDLVNRASDDLEWLTWPFWGDPAFAGVLVAALLVVGGAKVFVEGRYGITPGKWLLGLRTVRTTLRPCGFARALVRNVVYHIDLPLLLTPLPAAISLMFSDHRQRLGDRVADTLTIRAGSIITPLPNSTV